MTENKMDTKVLLCLLAITVLVFAANIAMQKINSSPGLFLGIDAQSYINNLEGDKIYQPLTIAIISLIVTPVRPEFYYFLQSFLLFIILPFLFYKTTKHWLAVPIYFSSYFVFLADIGGMFAQGLILAILLGMFLAKNNLLRIGLLVASLGIHSSGFILVFAWLMILSFKDAKSFLCTIPISAPTIQSFPELKTPVGLFPSKDHWENILNPAITYADVLNLFSRIWFLPLWFFSLQGLLKQKEWLALLGVILLAGVTGLTSNPLRVLTIAFIPLGVGLVEWFKVQNYYNKRLALILLGIGLLINLWTWVERKNFHYCML